MKNKSKNIRKAIEQLTDRQQSTLALCAILCSEEGITLRNLYDVIGIDEDPQTFADTIQKLIDCGLVAEQPINLVCCLEDVKNIIKNPSIISGDVLNPIIKRLCDKISRFADTDLMGIKPFYGMATKMMEYILHYPADDYNIYYNFSRLIVNLTKSYQIFAMKPDASIGYITELSIMKAISMCKENVNDQLLYARLITAEAYFLVCGFEYVKSRKLLDEALEIEQRCEAFDELAETYFAYALYYENFGIIPLCLYNAYRAYQRIDDDAL